MGQRGPASRPSILHLVNGNPSKKSARELPNTAAKPVLEVRLPQPPKEVTGEARKEWKRMGAELVVCGMMTALDKPAFMLYCLAWEQVVLLQRELNGRMRTSESLLEAMTWTSEKTGYVQKSALVIQLETAKKDLYTYMQQFGLSPSSRARVESMIDKHQAQLQLGLDEQGGMGAACERQIRDLQKKPSDWRWRFDVEKAAAFASLLNTCRTSRVSGREKNST